MTSPHRFLSNDRNAAALASIAASSILPAEATAFPLARSRQGMARAVIEGGYTGADDTALDIEIVTADGSGMLSAPVFAGAGNGAISELSGAGVPAQTFTLLLASTGTPTKRAAVDFYGVKLVAKPRGAAGNGIEIAVSTAAISAAPTVYSFLEEAKTGTSEFKGPQWDFGGYPLTADGEIDPRTPRLRFGSDPQVYRQYKTFQDGDWAYVLDPPIVRDLPAETPVYALTGSYAVTVTAGATIEPYPGMVTLFDLLNAIKTRSNLVDVLGVVVEDKTPGGMAADELPLRTDAYALPAAYAGNAKFPGLGAVDAPADAPTEIVTITCADTDTLGGERWGVSGSVSGAMPDCVTGTAYQNPRGYGFTVPRVLPPPAAAATGRIKVKDISFAYRPDGAPGVELCVKPLVAGAKAKAMTVEVVYTRKPSADCPCDGARIDGRLNPKCLGVDVEEGASMALDPHLQQALEALYAWRDGFMRANTALPAGSGSVRASFYDMELCDQITSAFSGAIQDAYAVEAARTEWTARLAQMQTDLAALAALAAAGGLATAMLGTEYAAGSVFVPPPHLWTGHKYRVVQSAQINPNTTTTVGAATLHQYPAWPVDGSTVSLAWKDAVSGGFLESSITIQDFGPIEDGDLVVNTDIGAIRSSVNQFVRRYQAAMDYVRALAGLIPKTDAGTKQGSECWQPCEGEFEWRVNGREYLPACTNAPYQSCVEVLDERGETRIVSTQEFGFIIRCGCPDRLLPGDKFSFTIENDAAPPKTYQAGDTIKIPIIAAAPLELAGGQDGDDTLTWTVRGSAGANWPTYAAPIGTEPLYDHDGLKFRVRQGGISFALGDQFQFAVAGGTFRWRRGNGAWSGDLAITDDPIPLADGLSLTFKPGPAPAFAAGDAWAFDVKQPHAPKLARSPDRGAWRWTAEGADWTADFAADTAITAVAIWHDCPPGATFSVVGLSADDDLIWMKFVPYRRGLSLVLLEGNEAVADCRRLRLAVNNAAGGSIRWVWCGVPWSPVWPLASVTLRESWFMQRGPQTARMIGRGAGGEIAWSVEGDNWLNSQDWTDLLALLEYLKSQHDEPFIFVPNFEAPDEARLTRVGADEIDLSDADDFQCDRRLLSVRIPLAAVPQ